MPPPLPLYRIDADLADLEAALLDAGGELTPEIEAAYDTLLEMRAEKLTGYVAVLRRLSVTADAYDAEAKRLASHATAAKRSADRIKERLLGAMLDRGETAHDTPLGRLRVQYASARSVVLRVDVDQLPDAFRVVTVAPDRRALADALKAHDPDAEAVAALADPAPFLRLY